MTGKTWEDQPDEVRNADILATVRAGRQDMITEIRGCEHRPPASRVYYLTTGTLFGSQTIRCNGEDVLWTTIRRMEKRKPQVPNGAVLLKNHSEGAEGCA